MKINVTYIVSDINKAIAFEWIVGRINRNKINLSFILINSEPSYLLDYLRIEGIPVYLVESKSKKKIPFSILKCCKILKRIKPDVVHCHLFMANIIGLTAAKIMGVKKRVYTRHHSNYHHTYFPRAVKYDKWCNAIATDIIAITTIVKEILEEKEFVLSNKITLIHHGFKLESFENISNDEVVNLKNKYGVADSYPIIGVISRYTEWKGIQYIIPAFVKLLDNYPNAKLILANASGDYESEITNMLTQLPSNNYLEIVFENNLFALYELFNVFVHVPIDKYHEAFGQTYIECMLSEIPLVATKSGIGNEILVDGENAIVVPHKNSKAIYEAIIKILNNKKFTERITENALETVKIDFSLDIMINKLERLYLS